METLPGQQLEAPRYNHPCGDLLDSGRREEYINICVPLYRALRHGDLEVARVILEGHEYLVRYSITEKKETPLHVVAAVHNSRFVRYLVDMMSKDDLELQNEEGNNAFCVAAITGNRDMAMIMLQKNRQLLTIRGSGNMMPLYLAAYHYKYDTMFYLYEHSQRMSSDGWTDDDRNSVFLKCIEIDCFGGALRILNDREELPGDKYVSNVLHVLAQKADVFHLRQRRLYDGALRILKVLPQDKYVWNVLHVLAQKAYAFHPRPINERRYSYWRLQFVEKAITGKESEATRHLLRLTEKDSKAAKDLVKKIWKKIVVKNKDEIDGILGGPVKKVSEKDAAYPSGILFVAAENGNTEFLVELFREYPDLIWKTDDAGQTIFHVGLSHHHESIFNLLCSLGAPKDTIAQLKDKDGNTLLHSVSNNAGRNPYEPVIGASSQLLSQYVWFERVRAMVPPSYEQLKNADGQTPLEVFDHNFKDIIFEAENWVKEKSNQCMVVATLITTISFSAFFTIPGGYNQSTGFPVFLRNTPFTAFVIFDAISFILSSLSILIFLTTSLSRYDTLSIYHSKFTGGFLALLFSIITLMAAFSASFFVLYQNQLPIIMSSLATLPIIIFFLMEPGAFIKDVLGALAIPIMPKKEMLQRF